VASYGDEDTEFNVFNQQWVLRVGRIPVVKLFRVIFYELNKEIMLGLQRERE